MKKLLVSLVMISLLILPTFSSAADVVVTITVPDAYVARLVAMVTDVYIDEDKCDGLTVKQCFAKWMLIEHVKKELFWYERNLAVTTAADAAEATVTEIEVTGQ